MPINIFVDWNTFINVVDQTLPKVSDELLRDLQVLVDRLASKASRLIKNFTTNIAENWMNVRCKFDGGKYVNRSQSGSFQFRCYGAGLQQNLGKSWSPAIWGQMVGSTPNQVFLDAAEASTKKAEKTRKRMATQKSKESRKKYKYAKHDSTVAACKAYSRPNAEVQPDDIGDEVSQELLQDLKKNYYDKQVKVTKDDISRIEQSTEDQAACDLWKAERMKRITASVVGGIAKMKKQTNRKGKVKEILYSTFRGSKATRYGHVMEDAAKEDYTREQLRNGKVGVVVRRSGLVVSEKNPWLACSPDGRVFDPTAPDPEGLIEIKNPYNGRDKTIEECCVNIKNFCLKLDGMQNIHLKNNHNYYYQVQCQMYCTDTSWCDFVVRTEKDIHIERISRDRIWWDSKLQVLHTFYFDFLLTELVHPTYWKEKQ